MIFFNIAPLIMEFPLEGVGFVPLEVTIFGARDQEAAASIGDIAQLQAKTTGRDLRAGPEARPGPQGESLRRDLRA
jgi:hypothetical protein